MSGSDRFEPAPFLVVSDLGQLRAFGETSKVNILRVLQRQEATATDVAEVVHEAEADVGHDRRGLHERRVMRVIGEAGQGAELYRASARTHAPQPPPGS